MKMYAIKDKNGNTLCYQEGQSAEDALISARDFYGHKRARSAELS